MTDQFDPYHKWLSIPPEEQPPNFYRLLATKLFETDPDVIESAADQRMAYLRTFQAGRHGKLSQQLLNEVSAARVTLLNPDKKAAYDQHLRQGLAAAASPIDPLSDQRAAPLPIASHAPEPDVGAPVVVAKPKIGKRPAWILPLGISVGALAVLAVVITLVVVISRDEQSAAGKSPPEQSSDSTTDQTARETADEISTDTDSPSVPDAGPGGDHGHEEEIDQTDNNDDGDAGSESSGTDEPDGQSHPPDTRPDTTSSDMPPDEPFLAPEPSEFATADKQPLPTPEQQDSAWETLEETFRLSAQRTSKEHLKLANELFGLANNSNDSVEKFVLLRGTMSAAGNGGDAQLVMQAVDEMDRHFEVDRFEIGAKALVGFASQATSQQAIGSLVATAGGLIGDAIAADRLEVADGVAEAAYKLSLKSGGAGFRKEAYERRKHVSDLLAQWERVKSALATLATNPDDADANLAAGLWYCFVKGEWETGLPHLAKGSDPALKSQADKELTAPNDLVQDQLALGDAWWKLAEDEEMGSVSQQSIQARAATWYRKALSGLRGLEKARADMRIAEAEKMTADRDLARGWESLPSSGDLTQCYKLGSFPRQAVDVRQVLLFVSKATPQATFQGQKLMPTKSVNANSGDQQGQIFWGPARDQKDHVMFYVFGIQSGRDQTVNLTTRTFTRWEHSTVSVFLDFQPIRSSGDIPLSPGKHTLVVMQHHKKSDRPGRSWVSVTIHGENLMQALTTEQPD